MPASSWSTMSDLFSLNLFSPKAFDVYLYPSASGQNSSTSLVDSLQDVSVVTFLTPLSSPKLPHSPETRHNLTRSPSMFLPSLSSPILMPSVRSSPNISSTQPSIHNDPPLGTPSLLDSSASFSQMMRRTAEGGSPTSFLSCSSGWDAGVICEAVALPSLLNTPPSLDTLKKLAAAKFAENGKDDSYESGLGLGITALFDLDSLQRTVACKSRIAVAATVYLNSSATHSASVLQASSEERNRYNLPLDLESLQSSLCTPKTSPFNTSPISDNSSVTSSFYEDPFHWDLVLSGLPGSPNVSISDTMFMPPGQSPTLLPTTKSSPLLPRPSVSSLLYHTLIQEEELTSSSSEPELSTASSGSSVSDDIPTIIVMNPDFISIPVQSSISSIVGMYVTAHTGDTHIAAVKEAISLSSVEEEAAEDSDTEEDEWWSDLDDEREDDDTEFEIVAVPALRTRLDAIFEEDGKRSSIKIAVAAEVAEMPSKAQVAEKITTSQSSDPKMIAAVPASTASTSWNTSLVQVTNSGTDSSLGAGSESLYSQTSRGRHFPTSSTNSTVKLSYIDSSGSSLNEVSKLTATQSQSKAEEDESSWLFYVQDGAVLEIPVLVHSSSSSTNKSKIADKLARFPNVPTSPFLSPFPSPLPSSTSAMRQDVPSIVVSSSSTQERSFSESGLGLPILVDRATSLFLSPNWPDEGRGTSSALASSTMLGLDLSSFTSGFPETPSNSLTTDLPSGLASVSKRARRKSRHVHFESADFRPAIANLEIKKEKPRCLAFSKARKSCFRRTQQACGNPLGGVVSPPPVLTPEQHGLSSSFSSSSLVAGCARSVNKSRFFGICTRVDGDKWDDDGEEDFWESGGGLSTVSAVGSWDVGDENYAGRWRKGPHRSWRQVFFP